MRPCDPAGEEGPLRWLRRIRADVLTARGRTAEAAALYRDTLDRSPADDSALLTVLGDCLRRGRVDDAIEVATAALAVESGHFLALSTLGWAYMTRGDHAAARVFLVRALHRYQELRLGEPVSLLRGLDFMFGLAARLPFTHRLWPRLRHPARLAEMTTESLEAWKESTKQYLASRQQAAPISSDAVSFRDAVAQFQAFLSDQGWPTAIAWVSTWTIARSADRTPVIESINTSHETDAASEYDAARDRGLGVCFDAICTIGDTTYATVLWPADARDAELLLYPSDGGLKLSVAVPRTEGRIRAAGRGG